MAPVPCHCLLSPFLTTPYGISANVLTLGVADSFGSHRQELAGTRKGWLKEGRSYLRELPCLSASLPLSLTLGGRCRLKCTVIHSPSLFNAQGNGLRPSTGVNTFMQAIISFKTFTASCSLHCALSSCERRAERKATF